MSTAVDGQAFLAIIEREIALRGSLEALAQEVEASGRLSTAVVVKRIYELRVGKRETVTFDEADAILTAIDREDALDVVVPTRRPGPLKCEDCGKRLEPGDVRILDLMRVDPYAPRRVYDRTKDRMVWRPRNSRRGGRRFRKWTLCRRCAGEALRQRAAKGGTVMTNGKKRALRTSERVPPKRGGRPRLLNEEELRTLHRLYETSGVSMQELAKRLAATREKGTVSGYTQSLLYGWRRLNLPLRPKGVQIALSRFGTDGTRSKKHKVRCRHRFRDGRRCTQWVRRVETEMGSKPADDGLCWNHGVGSREARLAA